MSNKETKEKLINALYSRGIYIRQINDVQFVTRCPYCGDSDDTRKGHFYIRIDPNDNLPIVFNCFKCPEHGVLREETLSLLDIDDIDLKSQIYTLNKTASKLDKKNLLSGTKNVTFDFIIPEFIRGFKTAYVEKRLGITFNDIDFHNMKVITSIKDFLKTNEIKEKAFKPYIMDKIEDHYVGFLTNGNSHILFRDTTEKENISWIKYPICKESNENRVFYTMACEINPLTSEPITINLAEGVMDTLSACYNLGYNDSNCMNISVSGKYYERVLLFLLDLGLVGNNITINIFSDNDYIFNKKGKNYKDTMLSHYKKTFSAYKHLYKEINIFYNQIEKDIGRPKEDIMLKKYRL